MVDFDPCSVEKPGLVPPEVILALPSPPLQTALPNPSQVPQADALSEFGLPPSPPTSASEGEGEEEEEERRQVNILDFINL